MQITLAFANIVAIWMLTFHVGIKVLTGHLCLFARLLLLLLVLWRASGCGLVRLRGSRVSCLGFVSLRLLDRDWSLIVIKEISLICSFSLWCGYFRRRYKYFTTKRIFRCFLLRVRFGISYLLKLKKSRFFFLFLDNSFYLIKRLGIAGTGLLVIVVVRLFTLLVRNLWVYSESLDDFTDFLLLNRCLAVGLLNHFVLIRLTLKHPFETPDLLLHLTLPLLVDLTQFCFYNNLVFSVRITTFNRCVTKQVRLMSSFLRWDFLCHFYFSWSFL